MFLQDRRPIGRGPRSRGPRIGGGLQDLWSFVLGWKNEGLTREDQARVTSHDFEIGAMNLRPVPRDPPNIVRGQSIFSDRPQAFAGADRVTHEPGRFVVTAPRSSIVCTQRMATLRPILFP